MAVTTDRRSLLLTGISGLSAFATPGFTLERSVSALRGFTHAVASGEPAEDGVLLWVRYVPPDGDETELRVEVAETDDFGSVVAGGAAMTGPWRDHTVKITVEGLRPGRTYWYRFIAPDGSLSPTGRTRTLPGEGARAWRAAVFSCSNYGFGWFNAYGHAAGRDDLDCCIHLGDYFYEYATGGYPGPKDAVAGRTPEPATDLIHLADYRLRYASYRADPDLQALHARLPMIAQWDDHESANDSWEGGAEHHHPAVDGDWLARRAAAVQAYREWMPVSDEPWKVYEIGDLATLVRTETRLLARTRQASVDPAFTSRDPAAALAAFRDGPWRDPARTMMGSQQEVWLDHTLRASVRSGRRWQVVGFGTVMGETLMPPAAADWMRGEGERARFYTGQDIAKGRAGLPFTYDNWGGYPAARARFLRSAQAAGANLVVISGDSHNAWAYDLAQDGAAVGVEFAGQSVTSNGIEGDSRADPREIARTFVAVNRELKWCDTSRRGYMALTLTPERASNDWVFCDTVKRRTLSASVGHRAHVEFGRNVMS